MSVRGGCFTVPNVRYLYMWPGTWHGKMIVFFAIWVVNALVKLCTYPRIFVCDGINPSEHRLVQLGLLTTRPMLAISIPGCTIAVTFQGSIKNEANYCRSALKNKGKLLTFHPHEVVCGTI
jgi:hypothetical protein